MSEEALVLRAVLEHVDERVAYLARGLQVVAVVTVGEDALPATPEDPVEPSREATGQTAHGVSEPPRVWCLHDQMNVVALQGKTGDARASSGGAGQ